MTTLLIALIAAITTTAEGLRFLCKHEAARRRAKNESWPPMAVLEIRDEIPF